MGNISNAYNVKLYENMEKHLPFSTLRTFFKLLFCVENCVSDKLIINNYTSQFRNII